MMSKDKPSRDVPDGIDAGLCNFRSILGITPFHKPLESTDRVSFTAGDFQYELDGRRYADGLAPVVVSEKGKRVRIRLQLMGHTGPMVVASLLLGGGFNNTCIFQNGSEIEDGYTIGTPTVPNPVDAMFVALHGTLSASLPTACAPYGSFVGLGDIGPHYVKKAAAGGTRRAMLDWPLTTGALLIPTVIAVMVEVHNRFVEIGLDYERTGRIAGSGPLLLNAPAFNAPQSAEQAPSARTC